MTAKNIYELDFTERKVLAWATEIIETLVSNNIIGISLETGELIDEDRYRRVHDELEMMLNTTTIYQKESELIGE